MKVSREQMAENRLRILDAASRLFREKGFDAVTVAEVMKAAGLTHGGFYGHFESKDDLVAQAITRALETRAGTTLDLDAYIASYLSPAHRDNPGGGCPTAGLAAQTRHQSEAARAAMTEGFRGQLERMTAALPDGDDIERRRNAIATLSAMVGAVILSRAIDDPELADEVLEATRARIEASVGKGAISNMPAVGRS
ncbi:TetR/AcrR family transcriptional repressor of nem operon [Ancylobacter sp. 3268]|uniref:TetR/AcrR family transcriptional regulator n=1 Tax=Ancylobacter sp. 3268 TaxID=2817752 RepID=UPI0028654E0A|nr:helix-turn-helix domain-containing protein [Ancylobacter sp. 3268]MDR6955915.1 TetR/AcrR family transcriptional repressor of nem operon [Ancylobacter sp. 3268]